MSDVAINQVLAQMRSMAARASAPGEGEAAAGPSAPGEDFSSLMRQSLDEVNQAMQESRSMADAYESGNSEVSLTELMVSAQRASLEFQALTQVRNKLLDAYQEVMRMQV